MRKRDELTDPRSCMSRAADDEMTFVLLGRDAAAPAAIRAWIAERIRLGKNKADDPQIVEAWDCAATMANVPALCRGCGAPLLLENAWMLDGCPCNSPLGCNGDSLD